HSVVSAIRRVLIAELGDLSQSQTPWAEQVLSGQLLADIETGEPCAMLAPLPQNKKRSESDWVLNKYVGVGRAWSTVTPVVLPGSDDGRWAKTKKLFCKALRHAGYHAEALADEPEFRNVPFWPGAELAR